MSALDDAIEFVLACQGKEIPDTIPEEDAQIMRSYQCTGEDQCHFEDVTFELMMAHKKLAHSMGQRAFLGEDAYRELIVKLIIFFIRRGL